MSEPNSQDLKMEETLLSIRGLKTYFYTEDGVVEAVNGVDLDISMRQIVGLVGESGCGKSTVALSIMRLVPNPGRILEGVIRLHGEDLLKLTDEEIRKKRGAEVSIIFQDPTSSLNPVFTIGDQIGEAIELHQGVKEKNVIREKVIEALSKVGIPDGDERFSHYPHEFSGGMKQRVLTAMATSCNPKLIIMDEPTTSLDVTTQAKVFDEIEKMIETLGVSVLLITHNLGLIAELCDFVYVMYAGKVVESGAVVEIFKNPMHPYTYLLMRAIPLIGARKERLATIPGTVPELINLPPGCIFADRCNFATTECRKESPKLQEYESRHEVACIRIGELDLSEVIDDVTS